MKRLLAAAVVLLGVASCSGTGTAQQTSYRSRPADAAVKVVTPELRQLKASAHIDPCPPSNLKPSPTSEGLPDITLPCLGGGRDVDIAGLRGSPLVLNFWSQTCGPCRTESPILQQVHTAAGDRVAILGVDWLDPRPSWAIAFAKDLGLTYPQVADPEGATRAALRITALPVTLFVDASGRIVHREYGPVESAEQLRALIETQLGVTVPANGG